jgi:adenosylcobinamide-GDP ribazoletransferase
VRRAFAFLTPLGGAAAPDERTLGWFPVVGAAIGAGVGAAWWVAGRWWPAPVAAGVAVAVDLALTGMLHFDGLVDAADGLLPHLSRERRLEVMAEPTVGAYGVVVAVAALLLRFSALAALRPNVLLVAAVWSLSRTAMAVAARTMTYARADGGLATAMRGGPALPVVASGLVIAGVLAWVADAGRGEAALVAVVAGAGAVLLLGRRQVGGFTGDVLGAAGVVGETLALLMAAIK